MHIEIYYFKLNLKDIENTGRYGYWEIWQKLIMQFKETIPEAAYEYEADTIEEIFGLMENSIEDIVEEYQNNYGFSENFQTENKNPLVKNLSVREWECPKCHTKHDRDVNASINILNKGLQLQSA